MAKESDTLVVQLYADNDPCSAEVISVINECIDKGMAFREVPDAVLYRMQLRVYQSAIQGYLQDKKSQCPECRRKFYTTTVNSPGCSPDCQSIRRQRAKGPVAHAGDSKKQPEVFHAWLYQRPPVGSPVLQAT